MATALIIFVTAICALGLGVGRFEFVVGSLLVAPVFAYLFGLESQAAFIVIILLVLVGFRFARRALWQREAIRSCSDLLPLAVLMAAYILFYGLSLLWADFVSIGERIRDYALLAGVIRNPLSPEEPWMAGIPLNYYAYWYRFGHQLSVLGGLPVWETYHQLVSCTFALFFATFFELLRRVAGFSIAGALVGAAVTVLGSNPQGVLNFLAADGNWWSASRVVTGAIDEFPAWSFVLGDAHPHYLNLAFLPFVSLVAWELLGSISHRAELAVTFLLAVFVTMAWISNGNSWEFPVVLGLSLSALAVGLLSQFQLARTDSGQQALRRRSALEGAQFHGRRLAFLTVVTVLLCVSLYLSVRLIEKPEGMDLTLVKPPIPRTPLGELLLHWGFALALIGVGLVAQFRSWSAFGVVVGLGAVLSLQSSWGLLTALIVLCIVATVRYTLLEECPLLRRQQLFWAILGGTGLTFILIPEFLFFNDSYGPEIERMNTIFKFYNASWALVYGYGLWLISRFGQRLGLHWMRGTQLIVLLVLCGFFYRTIGQRHLKEQTVKPLAQGLSDLDRKYSGAGKTIQELATMPLGIVLEAQGGAYSLATHVATLSNKPAYLGWSNHIGLLARNESEREEMRRRQSVTNRVYTEGTCEETARLVQTEKIAYIVLGPLERAAYPGIDKSRFSCLELATGNGEYLVFSNRQRAAM